MTTENDAKIILREKGLCGHVYTDGAQRVACVLDRHHDDDAHEKGWTVTKRLERSAYRRDEREPDDVYYDVKENRPIYGFPAKVFTTSNKQHAEWLASTLTRLEL